MARKAGINAMGSMMTNNELAASKMYSGKLCSATFIRTGQQDRLFHPMDDLLVGRADRGQHPAQVRSGRVPFAQDEVKWTEPHPAVHGNELVLLEVEPMRLDHFRLVIPLQHKRASLKIAQSQIHR